MIKVHLTRDKKTGDWYTKDRRFRIEKCSDGWNIYDIDPDNGCRLTYPTGWALNCRMLGRLFMKLHEGVLLWQA